MKGVELGRARDVLCDAFNLNSFSQMLAIRLNKNLGNIVGAGGGFKTVVFDLLQVADEEGWDALVVAAAAKERPLRPDVQALYRDYAASLVGVFKVAAGNPDIREAYRQFGLAPEGFPDEKRLGELEGIVRPALPFLNIHDWVGRAARIEGQVCRVEFDGRGVGTGFLVGPDMLLTNYHVLKDVITGKVAVSSVTFRFDFKIVTGNVALPGTPFKLVADQWLIDDSPYTDGEGRGTPGDTDAPADQLDYALVRLEGDPGRQSLVADGPPRGWVTVPTDAFAFAVRAPVFIVQHPQARPLKLALDTQGVIGVNAAGTRVRYATNTEAGSSGSPVFNLAWDLVALHHYGDPAYDHMPKFNQGVPVASIRALLKDRKKDGALATAP
jgi:Trypsin-like peptidase domain/Effector-associated domain 1